MKPVDVFGSAHRSQHLGLRSSNGGRSMGRGGPSRTRGGRVMKRSGLLMGWGSHFECMSWNPLMRRGRRGNMTRRRRGGRGMRQKGPREPKLKASEEYLVDVGRQGQLNKHAIDRRVCVEPLRCAHHCRFVAVSNRIGRVGRSVLVGRKKKRRNEEED